MPEDQIKVELLRNFGNDLDVVNAARTKTHKRIIEAYERGYRVSEDGVLSSKNGVIKLSKGTNQNYPTFSTNWGFVFSLPAHQFAAYCFYGDKLFVEGIVVRHGGHGVLDISKDNISIGTHKENNMDKHPEVRKQAAKIARASQGYTPKNAKLNDNDISKIINFYQQLAGKKAPKGSILKLGTELGVSRTVICNVVNGKSYCGR